MANVAFQKLLDSAKALLRQDSQNQQAEPGQPPDGDKATHCGGGWLSFWRVCHKNPSVNSAPHPPAGDHQESAEHQENERAITRATIRMAKFNGAIAAATIVNVFISGGTLWAIKSQLDAMEADRRPWVSVKPVLDGIFWNKVGANIRYHLELTNPGRETGLNMMVSTDVIPFSMTPGSVGPSDWVRKESENFKNAGRIKPAGFPIFPNGVFNFVKERTIEWAEIGAFNEKIGAHTEIGSTLMPINLAFVINYFSPNGAPHQTYCWAIINKINTDDPFSVIDEPIKVEVDVRGDALQLRNFGINCGAY